MNRDGRGLVTTAAFGLVFLVGALAIADSVRACDRSNGEVTPPPAEAPATTPTTTESNGLEPRPDAPQGWPEGTLDGVLTFVDGETCQIRAIGLSGGRERPLQPYDTDCLGFWAPRIGARVAYANGDTFLIADLGHGNRDYGQYVVPDGEVIWSFDAQRLAWCIGPSSGIEHEVLGGGRRLPFCPIAYAPDGNLARAEGNRLVVGTRTVLTASGRIGFAQFGLDGSIAVLVNGSTLERYAASERTVSVDLPTGRVGDPVFSPDTCAAAVAFSDERIEVFPLCAGGERLGIPGHAPSWSPNGEWLAYGGGDVIVFIRKDGRETLVWPAAAAQLAWRPS